MTISNIADKIAKVIAKADSTTNEAEAEVFMAKAHQLLEEHGLTLLDLGRLDSDDPVGTIFEASHNFKSENWASKVCRCLAYYYGCRLVTTTIRNKIVHSVVGRESARTTYMVMQPYVVREVRRLARKSVSEGYYSTESRAKTAIGNAMALRLSQMASREEERRSQTTSTGTGLKALVPVDLLEQEMQEQFPNLKIGRSSKVKTDSYAKSQAEKINLNKQTPGRSASVGQLT